MSTGTQFSTQTAPIGYAVVARCTVFETVTPTMAPVYPTRAAAEERAALYQSGASEFDVFEVVPVQ